MRNRLVISVALGVLVAVLTAGVVSAQSVSVGKNDVSVDLPNGSNVQMDPSLPLCSNGTDDDGDGLVDFPQDPGCASAGDADETDVTPPPVEKPTTTAPETTTPDESTTTPEEPEPTEPDKGGKDNDGSGSIDTGGPKNKPGTKDPFGNKDKGKGEVEVGGGKDDDPNAPLEEPAIRRPDGAPTNSNPSVSITDTGSAPIGVPNFIIDEFTIPPFLLPIYQACGTQYGVPWNVLASINRIETAFGTNLNVSTAGALGWMQFMPATWEMYGVDANGDGRKDPFNPVDAVCAAAKYLDAAGWEDDPYGAIFAYNHADWYVQEVLLYAKQYDKLPSELVDSLTVLTEARFPVAAKARYADDISEREAMRRSTKARSGLGNAADVIGDSPTRRGIDIFSKDGAPVVAVNDGVITKIGKNKRLGRYIVLRDTYGNEFLYSGLGELAKAVPVPKERKLSSRDFDLVTPGDDAKKPTRQASSTTRKSFEQKQAHDEDSDDKGAKRGKTSGKNGKSGDKDSDSAATSKTSGPINTEDARERLYALPERPANIDRANLTGQIDSLLGKGMPGYETFKSYFSGVLRFNSKTMDAAPLRKGTKVVGGTVLGEIAQEEGSAAAPHVHFEITPAGRGAKTIDPKPILDGWKLLEATAIYRAAGKDPFAKDASVGQVLLASKSQLQRRVLADPDIETYSCGRQDIATGQIDRRVLAMLEYLVSRGYRLTITSLKCGHGTFTTSGNVSAHSTGDAVDIAQVNGIPILGNQGKGSITEAVIKDLLQLQGTMSPAQVISLMELGGPTFAMADHADHIHVGYTPDGNLDEADTGKITSSMLAPDKWDRLLDRIGELDQPSVPAKPSKFSLPSKKRASNAHAGE